MRYIDKVYGQHNINEPILVELIDSRPIQRLRGLAQFGIPDRFYHLNGFSRFEHSLGVMILLKILGADLKEQIAGLLHDVSHTAFSHVFDWVVGDMENEDFQSGNRHKTYIIKSEISNILKRYSFNIDEISDIKKFSLLEQKIPRLCADRIDYVLREFPLWIDLSIVNGLVKNLQNYRGKIVFSGLKSAQIFAKTFLKCQRKHWGEYEAVARYHLLSSIIKNALDKKILSKEDFYQDDNFVINKLIRSGEEKILKSLNILKNRKLSKDIDGMGKIIVKKFRYVDPEIMYKNKIKRLSQVSSQYKNFLEKQRKINQKGIKVFLEF